jgi:hypothetical protein
MPQFFVYVKFYRREFSLFWMDIDGENGLVLVVNERWLE